MKKILVIIAIVFSIKINAQVSKVSLQASGLTCSMCSNAINKSLKTLDFVQNIAADIKTYTFEITFKQGSLVDFDVIRKKVESAGFAVCSFIATIHFDNAVVNNSQPLIVQNHSFLFLNNALTVLNGDRDIRILDKGFVTPKEYKKNKLPPVSAQRYHVTL